MLFSLNSGGVADFSMVLPTKDPPITMPGTWTASGNSITMAFGPISVDAVVSGNQMAGTVHGKESPPFTFTATKQ